LECPDQGIALAGKFRGVSHGLSGRGLADRVEFKANTGLLEQLAILSVDLANLEGEGPCLQANACPGQSIENIEAKDTGEWAVNHLKIGKANSYWDQASTVRANLRGGLYGESPSPQEHG
jgi:hypothetical protein